MSSEAPIALDETVHEEQMPEAESMAASTPDTLRPHEGLRLIGINAIVLFHAPGAGGSTIGRELARRLGARFYDGGKDIRSSTSSSHTGTAFSERGTDVDLSIDERQKAILRSASPFEPVVIDAKLSGANALELETEDPNLHFARIHLICDEDVAAERIFQREVNGIIEKQRDLDKDTPGTIQYLETITELGDRARKLTARGVPGVKEETRRRIGRDNAQFARAYPGLEGIDIYAKGVMIPMIRRNPVTGATFTSWEKMANVEVSTTTAPDSRASVARVIEKLEREGMIRRLRRRPGKFVDLNEQAALA